MKILYVEDNEDNIYMLERRLKRAGFDVLIARDGAEGVAMAGAEQPDLILMGDCADAKLPRAATKTGGQMLKRDLELLDAVVTP